MTMRVLVTGGAGFIGAQAAKQLREVGYETVVIDNLSKGNAEAVKDSIFIKGNVGDGELLKDLFKTYTIDLVMHFAASINVGESVQRPDLYYQNNVVNSLALFDAMIASGVKNLVFSSTAAIFGIPTQDKVSEEHPCRPINPYGESKLAVEKILRDYDKAFGLRSSSLRYFNAAGGDPDGEIKNFKVAEHNLIPTVLRSLLDDKAVKVNGTDYPTEDGTCIRDYIHIYDLCNAHILAMEQLLLDSKTTQYNLGNGHGYSVLEVIRSVERVTGKTINVINGPRRPGDPPVLVADATKAQEQLTWHCRYPDLDTIVAHAWHALPHA